MTTIAIGSGRFTLVGGAFAHNPLPRITPLMGDREASTAALTLPLRFGMGRWDCARLDGLAPDARAEAMAGYLRRAKATHWLRHDMTLRTDGATTLSAGAEAELWRRLEEGTRLSRGQMEDWLRRSFGTPRHHPDLEPWMAQVMPFHSFTLNMGLVPMMIGLRPAEADLPQGVTLMLSVLVDGMYMLDIHGRCGTPPGPMRQALPLRGLAGTTDDAKRWSLNVARLTAKTDPRLSSLLGRLRRL